MSISLAQTARQSPHPAPFQDCSKILSCPVTGQALRITENWWISADGSRRYPVEDGSVANPAAVWRDGVWSGGSSRVGLVG